MAPNLAPSKHELIYDMLHGGELSMSQMAKAAGCSRRTILRISSNLRTFSSAKAPPNKGGRLRSIDPAMLEALCDHLLEKPNVYLDEMALFLWYEFDIQATKSSISRALTSKSWSKKIAQVKARERHPDIRDEYSHFISDFKSYHLVYVDESGCDKRIGFRRTGWSPLGVKPVQVSKFHRDRRWQILPAYCQDGIVFSRVFQGSTDASVFEDFVGQLLQHCGKWPEPKSVLVMDNASFHHSALVERMCSEAGVKLVYLPPYSPDLNPIEEFFAELKAFIRRHWQSYEDNPDQGFDNFLDWCVSVVGARGESAQGHFRHAGLTVEEA